MSARRPELGFSVAAAGAETIAPALGEAFVGIRRALRRATRREVGLTPLPEAQREVLLLVAERPGITVGGAAEILQLAPNTVSTLLRQLVGEGYLERRRDLVNRRVVHIEVTVRARERMSRYKGARANVLVRALSTLDEEERRSVAAALPALAKLAGAIDLPSPLPPPPA